MRWTGATSVVRQRERRVRQAVSFLPWLSPNYAFSVTTLTFFETPGILSAASRSRSLNSTVHIMPYPCRAYQTNRVSRHLVAIRASRFCVAVLVGAAVLGYSTRSYAQITQGNGASQQDNRTSSMGSVPDPAASMPQETRRPQTSSRAAANSAGKAGKDQGSKGAGGFDNGLYGTGAGGNKK